MIDLVTGSITIEGLAEPIGANTKLKRFLALTGFAKPTGGSSPMSTYALGVRRIADRRCYVNVSFFGEDLETIEFVLDGSELPARESANETDDALFLHEAQRAWLREILGPPTHPSDVGNDGYAFPIGSIGSCYSPRDDMASILARYRWMGRIWGPA